MKILDCLPNGAGTCRNEAMIKELQAALESWRRWLPDDDDLRDLQEQAQGRDKDYKDSLGASSVYIFALERRIKQAEAERNELRAANAELKKELEKAAEAMRADDDWGDDEFEPDADWWCGQGEEE